MSETQMLTVALSTVPTFLVVLAGILINNSRLSDLRAYIDARFSDMARVIEAECRVSEANFKMLLARLEEVGGRLGHLEDASPGD